MAWSIHKKSEIFLGILDALWSLKIIAGYTIKKGWLIVYFKYSRTGKSMVTGFSVLSKPGRKIFKKYKYFLNQPVADIYLLKTSQGVIHSMESVRNRIGGEVILKITR